MKNKSLFVIISIVTILLLIPAIAMQFTDEVNWTLSDFLIAGILLLGAGLAFDFIFRKVKKTHYRIVLSVVIFAVLLLIWMELAVGIMGPPPGGN